MQDSFVGEASRCRKIEGINMSQRKVPFHFDESEPLDKSAWKRFGFRPEEERRMFFETSPMNPGWSDWQSKFHRPYHDDPEWRGRTMFPSSDPDSPSMQRRMRGWNSASEDGSVPIKVVHEKTPPRSNDDGTDSETSSQASHGSQGSSSSQPQRAKITREPRVHHIPIMVEPREGSTSSGYASDGATEAAATNHDAEHQDQPPEEWMTRNVQNLCKNFETQQTPKPDSPRVNAVPIRLNGVRADSPNRTTPVFGHQAEPFPAANSGSAKPGVPGPNGFQPTAPPRQRSRASSQPPSSPQPQATTAGPHVTRIPMNMDVGNDAPKTPVPEPEEKPEKKAKTGVDQMTLIAEALKEVSAFEKDVEAFSGTVQDKRYRYLDEMLTRCMLKLDNVETEGRDDIRQSRKAAIREVQKWINQLESKVRPNDSNAGDSMETESTAVERTEEMNQEDSNLQKSPSEQKMEIADSEKTGEHQSVDQASGEKEQMDATPKHVEDLVKSPSGQDCNSSQSETEKLGKSEPQDTSTGQ